MLFNNLEYEQWQKTAKQILGNDFMNGFFSTAVREGPRYNLYHNTSEIIVLVELPYISNLSDIKLVVREKEIVLKGKIELGFEHMEAIQQQIFAGQFEKKIPLPEVVNTKKVNAQYQKGILKVQLFPKLRSDGHAVRIQEL